MSTLDAVKLRASSKFNKIKTVSPATLIAQALRCFDDAADIDNSPDASNPEDIYATYWFAVVILQHVASAPELSKDPQLLLNFQLASQKQNAAQAAMDKVVERLRELDSQNAAKPQSQSTKPSILKRFRGLKVGEAGSSTAADPPPRMRGPRPQAASHQAKGSIFGRIRGYRDAGKTSSPKVAAVHSTSSKGNESPVATFSNLHPTDDASTAIDESPAAASSFQQPADDTSAGSNESPVATSSLPHRPDDTLQERYTTPPPVDSLEAEPQAEDASIAPAEEPFHEPEPDPESISALDPIQDQAHSLDVGMFFAIDQPRSKSEGEEEADTARANSPPADTSCPSPQVNDVEEKPCDPPPLSEPPEPEIPAVERAERLKELGNECFMQQKYSDAFDHYTQAIDLNPEEPTYMTNRAAAAMALKRFKMALADCQAAVALQTDEPSAKTLIRLGKCHLALGKPSLAISTIESALRIEPGNEQAKRTIALAHAMDRHLKDVEEALARRAWSAARLALDAAEQACEGEPPLAWWMWRTRIDLGLKQFDFAKDSASNAWRLSQDSPDAPDALVLRGLVRFLTGDLPQAILHAQHALLADGEHAAAWELLKRARDVERIKEEGNNAFRQGKTDEAIAKFTESLNLIGAKEEEGGGGTLRATQLNNRAAAYMKANRPDQAIADATACLAIEPSLWKALRIRARAHLANEDFDAAIQDFRDVLKAAKADKQEASVLRSISEQLRKAEVQQKAPRPKNYYKILGVERTCSDADIKKAYRRLSLIHHPDKGGDEEKFKLISEAYEVLSDPEVRQVYDTASRR